MKDVPISAFDRDQYCFYFQSKSGTQFVLPQFELARVLFFRDGYLARSSLVPGSLQADFDVHLTGFGEVVINVQPYSDYPVASFKDFKKRQQLTWILMDEDIQKSYESVAFYQLKYGEDRGLYRRFNFRFDPPLLRGAQLAFRGRYLQDIDCMLVFEITNITNIANRTAAKIEFYHPKEKEYVQGAGRNGKIPQYSNQGHQDITPDDPNAEMKRQLIGVENASLGFVNPIETSIIYKKKQVGNAGRPDQNVVEQPSGLGSVEDSTITGKIAPKDWTEMEGGEDVTANFENRLSEFFQMIDLLQKEHGCKILSKEIRKFPAIKRCTKHFMTNSKEPRRYVDIELESNGRIFRIIEVDTSDGLHPISTLLLVDCDRAKWLKKVQYFEKEVLRRSINWPGKFLKILCGQKGFKRIPHPRNTVAMDLKPNEIIRGWANRFYQYLN